VLTRNHRQEALCRAYVQAIAALAGVGTSVPLPDYGVDLSLRNIEQRGSRHFDGRLQLDLQLRSTTRAGLTATEVRYDVDVQTYAFLRALSPICCLLVVLVLPENEDDWLTQSPQELVLRHCAYWYSLRGEPERSATSSVRVVIPRSQVFSPQAIRNLFTRLSQGAEP
jgi:hypothetical protein